MILSLPMDANVQNFVYKYLHKPTLLKLYYICT